MVGVVDGGEGGGGVGWVGGYQSQNMYSTKNEFNRVFVHVLCKCMHIVEYGDTISSYFIRQWLKHLVPCISNAKLNYLIIRSNNEANLRT